MDSIIIFDLLNTRKEVLDSVKYSYDRPYSIAYTNTEEDLKVKILEQPNSLLYLITSQVNSSLRILIRNIQKALPQIKICLCSQPSNALDAWKLNLFHFLEIPVVSSDLISVYQKYVSSMMDTGKQKELRFKLKDGIVTLPYSSICFIKASGNYSTIHSVRDKTYLQTKQLHKYLYLCEENAEFVKVHRSLILNLNRVNTVGTQKISFFQSEYKLPISKTLEGKIKRLILGT